MKNDEIKVSFLNLTDRNKKDIAGLLIDFIEIAQETNKKEKLIIS